jgi:hypothetical protein
VRSIAPAIWAEVRIEGSFGRSWKTGAPDRVTRLSPLSNLSSHRVIDHHHLTPPPGIAAHVAPTGWPAKLRPYKMIGGCAPQPAQCTRTVGPKYSPPDSFHTPPHPRRGGAATRPPPAGLAVSRRSVPRRARRRRERDRKAKAQR